MAKFRYLIDTLTGLAGLVFFAYVVFQFFKTDIEPNFSYIFLFIGLFRLNMLETKITKRSNYSRLQFIGLAITIAAMLMIYLDVLYGNILLIIGVGLVCVYQIVELVLAVKKDYLNILHILIYLTGIVYVIQINYHIYVGANDFYLFALLNMLVFSTLTISGIRSLTNKEPIDADANEVPIDYPMNK